ncbi:hypothetical protein DFJ58DRAFT_844888 [Suillus subalutaceus]|uniref:uncharacterized protein n=1 Tax=Suillus subalutaceus TaxID=48586 RepID=UPI001B862406|nr:uncharacterized protein DFJ58DRAFT_844888 [Suillus subalutaceus]KAG1841798.1 hypothetical protein DFJ58DRAFT_844888 [Suillus subalutaceus]
MKDKELTSIKTLSQTTRPYPSTPHHTSQTPRTGPLFFPPNVLNDDNNMEPSPNPANPPSPTTSLSPPNTPTPTPRTIHDHTSSTETCTSKESDTLPALPATNTQQPVQSDLVNSIHAPQNMTTDQEMSAPPYHDLPRAPTAEEENILAHIALAEQNRSIVRHDAPNHLTTLPQFTPTPSGGFPIIYMSHSAQVFDHLDNRVLLAWFQVNHPKFIVRVFEHTGKDVYERSAVIAERIRTNIAIIANFVHQGAPPSEPPPHNLWGVETPKTSPQDSSSTMYPRKQGTSS